MKVVQVASSDLGGGAAIAAYRLHRGLNRIGVDSRMLAADKRSGDDTVDVVRPGQTLRDRLRRRLRSRRLARDLDHYRSTQLTDRDVFSDDRAVDPQALVDALPPCGIYHLHWIAGFLDYTEFFGALRRQQCMVWTLHDMNPFTGGCHYAYGCDKFADACGACPALGSARPNDLSAAIIDRKRLAIQGLRPENVRIVAPSRWMAREAARSTLFKNFDVSTIPYGLDTDVFVSRNKTFAREVLGIPQDLKVVMFVSQLLENHRKGIDLLSAAIKELSVERNIGVLSVGLGQRRPEFDARYFPVGELSNERMLALVYSAADLFVCPTREDNLPNVVLEAMACGTPVVAFDVGGLSDMIRPGQTGTLVPRENVGALRDAMAAMLDDDASRARMSQEARRVAVAEYSLELQAQRYLRLYEDLLTQVAPPPLVAPLSVSES